MLLPPPLPRHRSPVVQVIGPSGPLGPHEARLKSGIEHLRSEGFKVRSKDGLSNRNYRGYLCGEDHVRQAEFVMAAADPQVDIIWWARGGSGAGRIQEELIGQLKSYAPKWLIGFSDATSLLNAISINLDWVTLHGPTVTFLEKQPGWHQELREVTDKLTTRVPQAEYPRAQLPLIYGGNITVLASIMGTIDLSSLKRHVLLLEDVGEVPYRLDRALTQIRRCWPVHAIEEIWLGDLDLDTETSEHIAQSIEIDFKCPVRRSVRAGHRGELGFMPLGYDGTAE